MKKILLYIISLAYLLFGQMGSAMAQSEEFGTDVLGGLVTAGGTRDLFDIIVGIVNVVLYFLGGIAVILGLYAGWLWFTSRGNAEQIRKAKAIMVSAVIGLAIIFASYAITNFVIGNLYSNTLGNNETIPDDGGDGDGDGSGNICPPPANGSSMVICTHSGAKPVGGYVTITGWNFGDYIEGASQVTINGVPAPLVSCNSTGYWNRRITSGDSVSYRVKAIVPDVPVGSGYEIKVQNNINNQPQSVSQNNFSVLPGSAGLNIACFEPTAGARNTTVVAKGINFGTTGNRTIRMSGWTGLPAAVAPVDADYNPANWSDTQITFTIPNEALSSNIIIANDANTDQEFFRVSCAVGDDCQTGCCSNNSCVVCGSGNNNTGSPHINYITPDNGAENNLVTIYGSGFGTGGVVIFTGSTGATTNAQTPQEVYSSCTNFWTDNEIIVGVPEDLDLGTYSVTVLPSASTIASNGFTFTINNTPRPGICSATPNSGSFGTPVTITGVNFVEADGNTIKYGGEVGGSVDITVPNVAGSTVPNLRRGLVGVQINAGSEVSNPYSFAITDAIAGEPSIVNIDPIAGPAGTYLTINGTNFGSSKGSGKVVFVQGATVIDANFSFPLECTNYIWSSSRIMVKVPTALVSGTDYEVKVIRSDSKESNTKPFTANTDPLRPGLCAMYPDNGQKMTTQVSFYGDNFGTAQGAVLFYNGQSTTTSVWSNNKALYSRVPGEAETGPVSVVNSDGQESNSLNFRVGSCSRDNNCNTEIGEKCCTNSIGNYCATSCSNTRMCTYGWDFRTVPTAPEQLSVENKWPACDSSCGNVAIGLAFNVPMDPVTTQLPSNYSIIDVTPLASRVATETYDPINIDSVLLTQVPGANPEVDLDYAGTLQVNHTYKVTVSTDILSLDGERLPEPEVWEFTVGQGSCAFTGAIITPANYTTREPNQKIYYKADPTASNGSCGIQRLTCSSTTCSYNWFLNNTDVADWDARTINGSRQRTAISTTEQLPANDVHSVVSCTITQGSLPAVSASTDLHKDYRGYLESLIVTDYYPNCANACREIKVGMHFSSALDITTVNTTNIQIFDTSNGNENVTQNILAELNDIENPNSESVWHIITNPLVAGHRYHVVISKNVKNVFGNSLKNVFDWYFTMGSESCVVTGATVTPASFTAGSIGQSKKYVVQANSTTISCGRVPVNCSNCSYLWSSSDTTVATLVDPTTSSNVFATVAPTATSGTSSDISCQVTPQNSNALPVVSGVLNVELNTGSTLPPQIESFAPAIGSIPQCRNVAIEITFDQKMNLDSIKNNLKLYNSSNVALAGTFSFATINRIKTKVVFSPTELLVAGNEYRIAAGPGIVNVRGQALIFTNNPSLDPAAQAWKFTAGTEICEVSYVRTVPSSDWFSCGGNTCEDDDHPGAQAGNQHDYIAIPYSRQGTAISDIGMTYAWRVSPNEDSVSLTNTSLKTTTATAEENGRSAVSVTVTNVTSNISASASLPVTVSLCQNPWPSISNFPWNDSSFNFSTYYCQKFDDSSAALPYLNYPPVATSQTSNPDIGNKILAEYIFTVNINNTTSKNNSLGSLAYYLPKSSEQKKSVWQRISALAAPKQVIGQSFPPVIPGNINVAVNGSVVTINWSQPADWRTTENFAVQRKLNSATNWSTLTTIDVTNPATVPSRYVDNAISTSGIYNYKIVTCNDANNCADSTPNTVTVTVSATSETNFIIFRVMPNLEHLSVSEWYKSKFPGDALGTMTTVDGYEAMKVGNTMYISAANIASDKIHTNIYIIAYSVGANAQTKSIYDQFIANFTLNTNPGFSSHQDDNLCSTPDSPGVYRNCSSDLDCKSGDFCRSRSLKLRRDVKRVTDLLPVKKYLETYGISHLACSGNSQVTCTAGGNECGSLGPCVSYYPQLRSGTFVPGKSNSKWPSWQQTLATDLRQTLPLDPINRFSGCANGADPETCWNEASRTFECRDDSYIYGYVLEDAGKDYELYSNFEYDRIPYNSANFATGLNNGGSSVGVNAITKISTDLSNYCSISANLPGASLCGNGRVDGAEECDGGINYAQCSTLGDYPWWNDQVSGCNPPGTANECRWYAPVLTPAMCGGYCGDGTLQASYENCDANRYNGSFSCPSNGTVSCNNTSCNAVCADGLPAAKCGDGVLTSGREACDASASPNGLAIWDCPNNGNVRCTSCGIVCDNDETPYIGRCGDGTVQAPGELCDYANYPAQTPATADNNPWRYTCSLGCNFTAQPYCGDGILQQGNGELCDNYLLASTTPAQSSLEKQYQCRMTNDVVTNPDYTRCTPTIGGYCGDGIVQDGTAGTIAAGEKCDPLGYVVDDTNPSSVTHQYVCTTACQTTGGYCGDGVYNSTKEECDASAGTPNGLSGWSCTLDGNVSCNNLCKRTCNAGTLYAGQCGNEIVETPEQCDGSGVACRDINSNLYVGGYTACNANSCSVESTGSCCTTNNLSAKFMVDNQFQLFVNGLIIGTGQDWQTCVNGLDTAYDAASRDDGGACEFNVNDTNLFNYNHAENVVAFTAQDTGVAAGVVGTFSCQNKSCKSVCYQGSDAGKICTSNSDCASAKCASPSNSTTSCTWNSDCGSPTLTNGTTVPTASLCLPDDYGITTKVNNSLWRCTDVAPSGEAWKSTGFTEDDTWRSPEVAPTGSSVVNWWGDNQQYNWKHMVPGAEPIWLGGVGSPTSPRTIYCRYVIKGYNSSLPTPDLENPSVPTSLQAASSGSQISLTWQSSTDNVQVTGYNILRSITNGSGYVQVGTSNTNSYVDSGLQNRTYYYVVQAYDANGNTSANSAQAFATVDNAVPSTPASLTASVVGTTVSLSWPASTDNIGVTGYNIFRHTVSGGPYTKITTSVATSYTESLALGTYYYVVQAYDAAGNTSGNSPQAVAIMDVQAPSAPVINSIVAANNSITLNWAMSTDPEGSTVTYMIERATAINGPFAPLATVGTLSHSDTGLTNGTEYFYRIKARDTSNNQSAYSTPVVSAIPDNSAVAPNAPTALSIAVDAVNRIMNLNWTFSAPGPLVAYYLIERSVSATFDTFSAVGTTLSNTFSDNFDGSPAQVAVRYYYRVVAVGTAGLRSAAASISALFPDDIAPAPAPSALSGSFAGTHIALTWTASNDNIGVTQYLIERGTNVSGPFAQIGTSPSTSYNNTGFLPNATYYYQVRAQDAAGNTSAYSAPPVMVVARDTIAPSPAPVLSGTDTDPVITLSWTGTITDNIGVTNYIIRRSNSASGPFALLAGGTPSASPFVDTSAAPGSTYYYQVAAQDAAGNTSAYSNIESATAFSGPGKPIISNINTPTSAVSFTMNSSGGVNPRYFTVERADISTPNTFVVVAANVTAAATGGTLYTNSPVLNGTTYYYRVKCTDNAGDISEYSDTAVVTTQDVTAPTVPSPLNFFARPSVSVVGDINLSWNAFTDASGIKGYTIERRINGGGWQRLPTTGTEITTTGVTYTDSLGVPTDSNTYEYQLRAVDNSGYNIVTTWFSTTACNVAYCNQWDADTVINRSLCNNSCNAAQHCCQVCDNGSGVYMGCRVNTAPASCTLYTTAGTCR
jgi:fibronectin type 3 domain-containing protein